MPAKPKTTRRNVKPSPANDSPLIDRLDPRLARIRALLADVYATVKDRTGDVPAVVESLLDQIDWHRIDLGVVDSIFSMLWMSFANSEPSEIEERRGALTQIADGRHLSRCACCRRATRAVAS